MNVQCALRKMKQMVNEKEIEKLAYDEVKKRMDVVSDSERGAYFHGWFDCLYFVSEIMGEYNNK